MLYWLVDLSDTVSVLNVFRYITFRTGGAIDDGAAVRLPVRPDDHRRLRLRQGKGQPIRADGPQIALLTKDGTPTMGGLMILLGPRWSRRCCGPISPIPMSGSCSLVTLGFGAGRLLRRLSQGHQADRINGFSGRAAARASRPCIAVARLHRHRPARPARRFATSLAFPFFKELRAQPRLVLRVVRRLRHRRRRQRGEPDRRPRRPCHRAGDDRGGELRRHRLSRRQRGVRRLSADPSTSPAPASSRSSAAR